ncbi:MAG: alanyl-tRNA editing protein [Deltaproteobacteria bacterium]|nr:alanyl-tRNA editing protein [Deltaproteobacteria bacterium]
MTRLYLEDSYRRGFDATVVASREGACLLDQTVFHPGGGGQPHDRGRLLLGGEPLPVSRVEEDPEGRIWHEVGRDLPPGAGVRGELDWPFRLAIMRHHGLMHVVNTVAREQLGGVITGVQIGPERSRIDFRLPGFTREQIPAHEAAVNEVLARGLAFSARLITEAEFEGRPELVRTLNVLPPVVDGKVRVVEIAGFDAQACGGTHVHSTAEIGRARMVKFDNKGKDNKRFYWELDAA